MEKEKQEIFFNKVMQEPFARLLGIELKEVREGYARCSMRYSGDMDNLHGAAHGGAIFALIDEAFEISSNNYENIAVALNINVIYVKAPKKETLLEAEAKEIYRTRKTASYKITVKNENDLIAMCQALVYITEKPNPLVTVK